MSESDRAARASELFLALSAVAPAAREAWLAAQCGGDLALRREVESLLAALDAPDDFLDPAALHPPAVDPDIPLTPGTRLGDFTIQRVIGSGSAGIVYSAVQARPRRTVALKVLRRSLAASSARRRFEVEAELLGQLQHPGIAQVYAAHPGDAATPPFIAMELVDGPPITEFAREARLDVRGCVELIARVCDAVQHAHQHGVIHRDVKPGNVLVGRDGRPRVVDFGVARTSGAAVAVTTINTEVGQLVGTVPYMSPEQLSAVPADIDTRSDVYALGVILFRLLTGRLPFADGDPVLPELARRIAHDEPPRLAQVDASLGGDLDTILGCALAKDKERRYASAADLAADLRRWLAGQPVMASSDSAWSVVRRRLARYRRALAASAVAVVALGALAAYAVVQRARAERTNVQLANELSASNVERARLLGRTGTLLGAEELLWDELFHDPGSRHARWALWEIYARNAPIWTKFVNPGGTDIVRFDPAGRRLFTGGRDGRVRVVDPATGDVLQVLEGHEGPVTLMTHAPGGMLITTADDGLRVWRADGTPVLAVPVEGAPLSSIAVLDAARFAGATRGGGPIRVWSLTDGRLVRSFEVPGASFNRVATSPERGLLAAGSRDGRVMLWENGSGRLLWEEAAHGGEVTALAFVPGSDRLVAGGVDQLMTVLHLRDGRLLQRVDPRNGSVRDLTVAASGRRLAVAGWWSALVWEMAGTLSEPGSVSQGVWRADLSPDGRLLATCDGTGGPVRVWDLDASPQMARSRPHNGRVIGFDTHGNGSVVLSAGSDGTLQGHAVESHEERFTARETASIVGLAAAGDHAFVLGSRGQLAAWNLPSRLRVAEESVGGTPDALLTAGTITTALAFSPDHAQILVADSAGWLRTWHWQAQRFVPGYEVLSEDGEILQAAVHGPHIAVSHRSSPVLVSGTRHEGTASSVTPSLISGGTVVVRDRRDGSFIARLVPASTPFPIVFSPDGRWLAVGTWVGVVEIWEVATAERRFSLTGHSRVVRGLDISEDGSLLVSASRDGTVRLWDAATGRPLATVAERPVGASRARFLPGDRLVIGYDDGEIETLDLTYFFRHVAGQAEYQHQLLQRSRGRAYARGDEVLSWSRDILARARTALQRDH